MTKQQTTNAGRNRIMIFLSAVTAVMLLLCTGVPQVYAASESLAVSGTVTVGDFTVTSRSGNATITGYSGSGGEITLPQQVEIQGEMLTVTGMSANTSVFKGNKKIHKSHDPRRICLYRRRSLSGLHRADGSQHSGLRSLPSASALSKNAPR